MTPPIVLLPSAKAEFDEAADWYERQRTGLGVDFVGEVNAAIAGVASLPQAHPVVFEDVRRAMISRFPYVVLYRLAIDHILVIAVFHVRRDPAVWQARVR